MNQSHARILNDLRHGARVRAPVRGDMAYVVSRDGRSDRIVRKGTLRDMVDDGLLVFGFTGGDSGDIDWTIPSLTRGPKMAVDVTAPDGGPAFPSEHGHSPDAANVREGGMTLRDYFAAHALAAMSFGDDTRVWQRHTPSIVASRAYMIADAMLKARAERP